MKALLRFAIIALVLTACGDGRLSPQGGTITSVQGGNGLTGGGTGGLVTLNVGGGTGIVVGADSISVDTAAVLTGSISANVLPKGTGVGTGVTNSNISTTATTTTITGSGGTRLVLQSTTVDDDQSAIAWHNSTATPLWSMGSLGDLDGAVTQSFRIRDEVNARDVLFTDPAGLGHLLFGTGVGGGFRYGFGEGGPTLSFIVDGVTTTTIQGTLLSHGGDMQVSGLLTANGGLAANGVTLGTSSSSVTTLNGTLNANSTAGTNGEVLQVIAGLPQWGAPSSAGIVSGTGTPNRATKWNNTTGALVDTAFPIDDAAGTLTLGDTVASDAIQVNGRLVTTSTSSTNHAFTVNYTPSGASTNDNSAVYIAVGGTADTTAGQVAVNGFNVDATTTRGSGANNLVTQGLRVFASGGQDVRAGRFSATGGTVAAYGVHSTVTAAAVDNFAVNGAATGVGTNNYGGRFDAAGATNNYSIATLAGNNFFNVTSGNTLIGYALGTTPTFKLDVSGTSRLAGSNTFGASSATSVHTITGRAALTSTDSTNHGLMVTYTPSAGTTNNRYAAFSSVGGTLDTTAAGLFIYAGRFEASTTRSAGGNDLSTVAISGLASGTAQSTWAGFFQNTSTGTTNRGLDVQVTGAGTVNFGMLLTATGAAANVALRTTDGEVRLNTSSGSTIIGANTAPSAKLHVVGDSLFAATGTLNTLTATYAPTGSVAFTRGAVLGDNTGTYDTTASSGTVFAARFRSLASRSAGANALTNVAVQATALSGQVNIAFQSDAGDNYFNTSSGLTCVGCATGTTIPAKLASLHTGTGNAIQGTSTTSAAVAAGVAVAAVTNGTYNTTAGALGSYGFYSDVTSTRTAGANNLTNVSGRFNASGAQVNIALQTDAGDNYLNASGGSTGIGFAPGASLSTGKLSVSSGGVAIYGTSTGTRAVQGVVTLTANTTSVIAMSSLLQGTIDSTAGALTEQGMNITVSTARSAGANVVTNKGIVVTATSAQTNIAYESTDGSNYFNTSSGNTGVGYASGVALPAKLSATSSGLALDVLSTSNTTNASVFTSTPVATTTNSIAAVRVIQNGTFNTTAGVLANRGISVSSTGTRSAGANDLTNVAGRFDASGAQVNVALQTDSGFNYFNTSSGNTGVGYASGAALPGSLSVMATGGVAVAVAHTATALAGTGTATNVIVSGTYDATAAARAARGLLSVVSSTRSAGAFDLTNTAALLSASGAQINIALQTNDGANYFNTSSGNSGFGYASGAALPATLSVSGTLDATGAATLNGSTSFRGTSVVFGTATTTIHVTDLDTSARPTLANCGTGATIVGNDQSGKLTTGTTAGACTVSFNTAYSANVSCTITPRDSITRAYTAGTTNFAFTTVSDSQVYDYECRDH